MHKWKKRLRKKKPKEIWHYMTNELTENFTKIIYYTDEEIRIWKKERDREKVTFT